MEYKNQICDLLKAPFVRIKSMFPFGKSISVYLEISDSESGPWLALLRPYSCECDNEGGEMVLKGKHLLKAVKERIKRRNNA